MMVRVLAFCINAEENLTFTRGLSEPDDPDIWSRALTGQIEQWIDVGEPALDRIKKASRVAQDVKLYSFNTKSDHWWSKIAGDIARLGVTAYQFEWDDIQRLAALVERTMTMSVTITGESAFIATESGECDLAWHALSV